MLRISSEKWNELYSPARRINTDNSEARQWSRWTAWPKDFDADKNMRPRRKQAGKLKPCILQRLVDHLGIEFVQVENADLGAQGLDVLDDFVGLRFSQRQFVLILPVFLDQLHEGIDRKGVVPRGYRKIFAGKALRSDNALPEALPAPLPAVHSQKLRAFFDKDIPLLVRSNIVMRSSSSRSLIALDRLGWEINNRLAASFMEPRLATSMAYFNCCKVKADASSIILNRNADK